MLCCLYVSITGLIRWYKKSVSNGGRSLCGQISLQHTSRSILLKLSKRRLQARRLPSSDRCLSTSSHLLRRTTSSSAASPAGCNTPLHRVTGRLRRRVRSAEVDSVLLPGVDTCRLPPTPQHQRRALHIGRRRDELTAAEQLHTGCVR